MTKSVYALPRYQTNMNDEVDGLSRNATETFVIKQSNQFIVPGDFYFTGRLLIWVILTVIGRITRELSQTETMNVQSKQSVQDGHQVHTQL